jgi:hypothetical protein|tara:strand:+ start:4260 stop:4643 length:384 start_codon:yes stop_codon:yes gene_type:complete
MQNRKKVMQKALILIMGILAVGCLAPEQKQKDLRDSVVGEYEYMNTVGDIHKAVFLDDGIVEEFENGRKLVESKWAIVNGEIQVDVGSKEMPVLRINIDKSITSIANIKDGKRVDRPKEGHTFKKIK